MYNFQSRKKKIFRFTRHRTRIRNIHVRNSFTVFLRDYTSHLGKLLICALNNVKNRNLMYLLLHVFHQ